MVATSPSSSSSPPPPTTSSPLVCRPLANKASRDYYHQNCLRLVCSARLEGQPPKARQQSLELSSFAHSLLVSYHHLRQLPISFNFLQQTRQSGRCRLFAHLATSQPATFFVRSFVPNTAARPLLSVVARISATTQIATCGAAFQTKAS